MLTAVWAAVIVAVAFWAIGVSVAVYVMLRAGRLMSETAAAVAGLRERGDLLIERANATLDRAAEQVTKTEAITESMAGVTATMTELGGRLTALAPAARTLSEGLSGPLTWAAALAYGVSRALGLRRAARPEALRWRSARTGARHPARDARLRPGWRGAALTGGRPGPRGRGAALAGGRSGSRGRGAALAGRGDGTSA
jgi:hypothetical protein